MLDLGYLLDINSVGLADVWGGAEENEGNKYFWFSGLNSCVDCGVRYWDGRGGRRGFSED